jgi:hypothetical protein
VQGGLVGLDQQQVVGLLLVDQEPGVGTLGVQRVRGHDHPSQVERFQQGGEAGDFVRLVRYSQLGHGPAGAGHRGEQMGGRRVTGA